MSRKITAIERNILLENPEIVMFDPYRALKTHRSSIGKALILPVIIGTLVAFWSLLFPEFIHTHPRLFAGVGCAALIIAVGAVPMLYLVFDNRTFKNAKAEHYARQLQMLLPKDLGCSIAHVQWITEHKGEGGWILDGKEELFGFSSYVNYFKIEPDTDLAVISDGKKFQAFVKRAAETESFFRGV